MQRSHGLAVYFGKAHERDVYLHHRCFPKAFRLPRQDVMAATHPRAPSCWSRAKALLNHKITHSERKRRGKKTPNPMLHSQLFSITKVILGARIILIEAVRVHSSSQKT